MDGGSGLNLIYEETLQKMEIDWNRIERSSTTFRGIIPSREACCTGKITLDVVFGTLDNYRSEEVTFHVAPFSSGYHALLGREAFTIFQAIPHYGYMKLKMPGPNGIITLAILFSAGSAMSGTLARVMIPLGPGILSFMYP